MELNYKIVYEKKHFEISSYLNYAIFSVLNCVRLLTRVLPYIFEDPDWRGFFWSSLPGQSEDAEVSRSTIYRH